ncbi:MAG: DegT/DnrJ/EryC1/StrS family aminotransferase [Kiritimatiellae bacterium]|nr:DegT/DnrJ/EryC1/StrS family aminotransferase [Kiritimatiellia bacterium]
MQIPFLDLKASIAAMRPEIDEAIRRSVDRADFILGEEVALFENDFAAFCGCAHAMGVASGLDAIKLALRALGIGPGDEVITAANSFIASALGISAVGARPVLVDVDPRTRNMDVRLAEQAITPRTRALLPVHLYGLPADMDGIMNLAQARGLHVVEDAAQAHGARIRGKAAGSFGTMAAFSFYPGKNLGAFGDGGAVTTSDAALADRVRLLRNYGSTVKYHHEELGENSRLDTLHAAVLRVKLRHLEQGNQARRRIASRYTDALGGVGDIRTPWVPDGYEPSFHVYAIHTRERDRLMGYLRERGVSTLIHYPIPIHLQPAYASAGWGPGAFPVTERWAAESVSLPMYPELADEQVDYVVQAIREFFSRVA